jgi:hypothetical protein
MRKLFGWSTVAAILLVAGIALGQYAPGSNYHAMGGKDWNIGGTLDVLSGGNLDIESGGTISIGGTNVTSTAAELNILDGASVTTAELDQYVVYGEIADISTGASSWTVAPHAGDIVAAYTVIDGAITGADATITLEIGGTLVTDSSITIAYSGSAAGTVDSSTPSAANTVTAGQAVEIITDGGSTDAAKAVVALVIAR